jgi:polyhydroxyalkanoate synthesis regulator protein
VAPGPESAYFAKGVRRKRAGGCANDMVKSEQPVTIKQYGGQRLYHPGKAAYVTLVDLADMLEDDEDFVVYEAATGEDITRSILKQIIVERAYHG